MTTRAGQDQPRRSRAARFLLVLMVVVVSAAAAEAAIRLLAAPPGYFPVIHKEDSLYTSDPERVYALRRGAHRVYATPDLAVPIDVTADGLRGHTVAEASAAAFRVLAIGDSFTFGLAVRQEDTWAARLEADLTRTNPRRTVSVANAGVPGYNARQIRQRMEDIVPRLRPDLVILGLTTETFNRMQDPMAYVGGTVIRSSVAAYVAVAKEGLLYSTFASPRLRALDYWLIRHFQLGAHLLSLGRRVAVRLRLATRHEPPHPLLPTDPAAIREAMQPTLDEVAAMHEALDARGIPLLVLLISMQRPDGTFATPEVRQRIYNEVVMEECRREHLECVDVLPSLERQAAGQPVFRTPNDQHWTPRAHQIAADTLAVVVRAMRPGSASRTAAHR